MDRFDMLMTILEQSLSIHGNQELTVKHLLNMMKMVAKTEEELYEQINKSQAGCLDPNS